MWVRATDAEGRCLSPFSQGYRGTPFKCRAVLRLYVVLVLIFHD